MTKNHDAEMMAWAESDAPTIRPGAVIERATPEGHAQVRAMLEAAADSPDELATLRNLGGRPTLDPSAPRGKSPLWQVRAPKSLDAALRALAESEGRTFSAVLRDAAAQYIDTHPRAS